MKQQVAFSWRYIFKVAAEHKMDFLFANFISIKVVILDEATSSLDLKTEHALFQALKNFLAARTTIVIAHRLSTIMDAEKIAASISKLSSRLTLK